MCGVAQVQANAAAVRFLFLACMVLHFGCLSKCSLRNFVFRSVLESTMFGSFVKRNFCSFCNVNFS